MKAGAGRLRRASLRTFALVQSPRNFLILATNVAGASATAVPCDALLICSSSVRRVTAATAICSNRMRMRRPEPPEDICIDFHDLRVAARDDGRRPRFAGQQRHLAEVAARLDHRDFVTMRLEGHDRACPTPTTNIDSPGLSLANDRFPMPEHLVGRRRRELPPLILGQAREQIDSGQEPVATALPRGDVGLDPLPRIFDLDREWNLDAVPCEGVVDGGPHFVARRFVAFVILDPEPGAICDRRSCRIAPA